MTTLNMGGKITRASNQTSHMFNGLKYYSLEVTINEDHYYIQAFKQEATDPYDMVMTILNDKNNIMKKIE